MDIDTVQSKDTSIYPENCKKATKCHKYIKTELDTKHFTEKACTFTTIATDRTRKAANSRKDPKIGPQCLHVPLPVVNYFFLKLRDIK